MLAAEAMACSDSLHPPTISTSLLPRFRTPSKKSKAGSSRSREFQSREFQERFLES